MEIRSDSNIVAPFLRNNHIFTVWVCDSFLWDFGFIKNYYVEIESKLKVSIVPLRSEMGGGAEIIKDRGDGGCRENRAHQIN